MNFLVHEEWIGDTPILSENIEVHHFAFTQLLAAQCPKSRTISLFGRRSAAKRNPVRRHFSLLLARYVQIPAGFGLREPDPFRS